MSGEEEREGVTKGGDSGRREKKGEGGWGQFKFMGRICFFGRERQL